MAQLERGERLDFLALSRPCLLRRISEHLLKGKIANASGTRGRTACLRVDGVNLPPAADHRAVPHNIVGQRVGGSVILTRMCRPMRRSDTAIRRRLAAFPFQIQEFQMLAPRGGSFTTWHFF
jgi:hypothetical protein